MEQVDSLKCRESAQRRESKVALVCRRQHCRAGQKALWFKDQCSCMRKLPKAKKETGEYPT